MPNYRLYWMNELGHIEQVGNFEADDDAIAIAAVECTPESATMELWCGTPKSETLGCRSRQLAGDFSLALRLPD